ncbi:MAG TPA: hypothetical protein PKZ36_00110 [Candidatus Paceibacterota bacterium]|nr:hypothetical protein [Candidatus Paceibacterota bacterium]HPT17807.1 hypothetical protein [Candidatus Paceibacterota bacterium]
MRISGSFIAMVIVWALGFTHFLGGPYILFKIFFWIALLPFFITIIVLIFMLLKAKKITNINKTENSKNETIHVEATIKE